MYTGIFLILIFCIYLKKFLTYYARVFVEWQFKDPFPLQAFARLFFVCLLIFFFPRLSAKKSNETNKEYSRQRSQWKRALGSKLGFLIFVCCLLLLLNNFFSFASEAGGSSIYPPEAFQYCHCSPEQFYDFSYQDLPRGDQRLELELK